MSEPELPATSEPALPEAAGHEHEDHEHDHEQHEHEHTHEEGGVSGVLKTKAGCQDGCANCLGCTRRTKVGQ